MIFCQYFDMIFCQYLFEWDILPNKGDNLTKCGQLSEYNIWQVLEHDIWPVFAYNIWPLFAHLANIQI